MIHSVTHYQLSIPFLQYLVELISIFVTIRLHPIVTAKGSVQENKINSNLQIIWVKLQPYNLQQGWKPESCSEVRFAG